MKETKNVPCSYKCLNLLESNGFTNPELFQSNCAAGTSYKAKVNAEKCHSSL